MNGKKVTSTLLGTIFRIAIAAIVILFVYNMSLTAYDYGFRIFAEPPMEAEPGRVISVAITDGKNAREVGTLLEEKGLIRNAKLFWIQELLSEYKGKINPGAYELNTAMTTDQILAVIAAESNEDATAEEDASTADTAETATDEPAASTEETTETGIEE